MKVPRVGFRPVEMVSVAVTTPPAGATALGVMVTVTPVILPRMVSVKVTGCEKPLSEAMLMVTLTVCRLDMFTVWGEAVAEKSVRWSLSVAVWVSDPLAAVMVRS